MTSMLRTNAALRFYVNVADMRADFVKDPATREPVCAPDSAALAAVLATPGKAIFRDLGVAATAPTGAYRKVQLPYKSDDAHAVAVGFIALVKSDGAPSGVVRLT